MTMSKSQPIYLLDLSTPPPLGTLLAAPRVGMLTLREVSPYTRRDGAASVILTWEHADGRRFTTGLRARSLCRVKERT